MDENNANTTTYHIEGEISRITLTVAENTISLRLKPSPGYTRRDGDVEKVLLVSDGVEAPIPVLKKEFDEKDIEIPKRCSSIALLLSCRANRGCIRLEFAQHEKSGEDFPFAQKPVSLSVV